MLISSRSEYGLRALMDIAANSNHDPVGRSGIAERQQIPLPYLTQVLRSLVNGGLLVSTRGPSGGYRLSRSPEDISLLDVITLLQGPVSPAHCGGISQSGDCSRQNACGLAGVWSRLQSASEDVLRQTSLKSIIDGSGALETGARRYADGAPAAEAVRTAGASQVASQVGDTQARERADAAAPLGPLEIKQDPAKAAVKVDHKLDCIGAACPLPILRISEEMRKLKPGDVLEVWADDEGSKADIPAWCAGTGNEFLGREEFGKQMKFLIRKSA